MMGGDEGFDPNSDEEAGYDEDYADEEPGQADTEVDWNNTFEKSMNSGKKTIRVIIE